MKPDFKRVYNLLNNHFGDLKWWPAKTPFEVVVGAVLTQNTAWTNVVKAIKELKKHKLLNPFKIVKTKKITLAKAIRSSGYHNMKAETLKNISEFFLRYRNCPTVRHCERPTVRHCEAPKGPKQSQQSFPQKRESETNIIRKDLLAVKGIGPETADSILLYAMNKPVFVVDAYTKRIFSRHGFIDEEASYDEVQDVVHENFPKNIKKLNQFHALLVETGKNFCKKKEPLCEKCPLEPMPHRHCT